MSTAVQNLNANSTNRQFAAETTANSQDLLDSMPWLPCTLSVEVPIVRFTIADLLGLREGAIVETGCNHTGDLPLRVNRMLIGWTEFEVVGDRLAVRITEQI
jgi:flagellar motor switch/type III secretory pathway protein FliN